MEVLYNLFKNKKGIIIERTPKRFTEDVVVSFIGAGDNLTLILEDSKKNTCYRKIEKGKAIIPFAFLDGKTSVIVADLDNSLSKKYKCEGLICKRENNSVWIMPEGLDLPLEIVRAQEQIEELRNEVKILSEKLEEFKKDYECYDLI